MDLEQRRWLFNDRVLNNTTSLPYGHTEWSANQRICPHIDRSGGIVTDYTCPMVDGKSVCLTHWKYPQSNSNAKFSWPTSPSTLATWQTHENTWNVSWRWRFLAISYTMRCMSEYITHSAVAQHLYNPFASIATTLIPTDRERVFPEPILDIWEPDTRKKPKNPP